MQEAQPRDLVVVGASAGGVEALTRLVGALPDDLRAAVLVVLHVSPIGPSLLPKILDRAGGLPARHPVHHEALEPGRIYVAPPDHHLTVHPELLAELTRGPKVNGYRPSVDELFRSAAAAAGARTIGIVLSGALGDGSAGLATIAAAGGIALVQDPELALHDSMPRAALSAVPEARTLDIEGIASAIREHVEAGRTPGREEVHVGVTEVNGNKTEDAVERGDDRPGEITGFTCPECSGTLWEIQEGQVTRFQCRVGHAYSTESFVAAQDGSLEAGLWAASRALYEKAALSTRIALRLQSSGKELSARRFHQQADEARRLGDELGALIEGLPAPLGDESVAGI